jgi:spermidine/putrescine transport system ATP-binding protein
LTGGSAIVEFDGVTKRFGDTVVVDGVNLTISEGEFFALLGPSGCGKTTLLRMLAGLESPSAGRILIDGADVVGVPPNRRPVNMVFQSYAIFPHMTVAQNVAYGLSVAGVHQHERNTRVEEALALVKLDDMGGRKPDQLSGGQRQRVALARALVKRPRLLLMDEPLSALDARLRESMCSELAQLQRRTGVTFMMVTHDQNEALSMATRCGVMEAGVLRQVGSPQELYDRPNSPFVAGFIGSVNLIDGELIRVDDGRPVVVAPDFVQALEIGDPGAAQDGRVCVAIRPEQIHLTRRELDIACASLGRNTVAGTIRQASYLGDGWLYEVEIASGRRLKIAAPRRADGPSAAFEANDQVWASWTPDVCRVLDR